DVRAVFLLDQICRKVVEGPHSLIGERRRGRRQDEEGEPGETHERPFLKVGAIRATTGGSMGQLCSNRSLRCSARISCALWQAPFCLVARLAKHPWTRSRARLAARHA